MTGGEPRRVKCLVTAGALGVALVACTPSTGHSSQGWSLTDPLAVALAFATNLAIHESGHHLIASGVGANKATLKFFGEDDGVFFLGLSSAEGIPDESLLTYQLGGEIAASYTFELSLRAFRTRPTTFNSALLFFSGTDFLWYSLYSFYIAPEQDTRYDPVGIADTTGFNRSTILAAATIQLAANAWRVISGTDAIVPSFSFDRESALMHLTAQF